MNEDYFATHGQGPIDSRDQRLLRTLVGRIRLNQDRGNLNLQPIAQSLTEKENYGTPSRQHDLQTNF